MKNEIHVGSYYRKAVEPTLANAIKRDASRLDGETQVANEPAVPFCRYCNDTLSHPDDPTGQADCGYCGGSFRHAIGIA